MLLEHETMALAEQLADKLGSAVKVGKQAYYKQLDMPIEQAYAYTGEVMAQNMMHRDTEEGISAFIEKRPPNWEQ
jgi:enoyl-CoA hydratase/carnithine racemase